LFRPFPHVSARRAALERLMPSIRRRTLSGALATATVIAGGVAAQAADAPLRAPNPAAFDWSGFYVGGHVGYGNGQARVALADPTGRVSGNRFGNSFGGAHLGYNVVLPSRVLLGAEADVSFPNAPDSDDIVANRASRTGIFVEHLNLVSTLRGRLGYVAGDWMAYGTAGLAWSIGRVDRTLNETGEVAEHERKRLGWVAGAGLERHLGSGWSARLEYLYTSLGAIDAAFAPASSYRSTLGLHTVRAGLSYQLGAPGGNPTAFNLPTSGLDVEIHGQTTFIQQGYPGFRAPYSGANSLTPGSQTRNTWTVSAFIGVRLWEGGELYYNPELLQGFGLNGTLGVAGFPNGEAQKSAFLYPRYNTSRLFFRQTFGLGGERETVESDYGQMAGSRDISRVTIQVGKFAVKDVFDNNAYSQDPRTDFLNWSIWAGGAFDYPADKVGLTWGAVAELNQRDWAVRAGYFLIGDSPNSNQFDRAVPSRGGYIAELETRHELFGRAGKLRFTGWLTSSFAGSYRGAVELVAANPGLDATDAIEQIRRTAIKYGFIANLEQSVTDDIGLFARWSWNNGQTEISAFTDIDSSLSGGLSIKGSSWGRPNDRIGLGFALNNISQAHRNYLAIGGLGILIGDGQLNYRSERVLETFYALELAKSTMLTFDYQLVVNPAYNADRGPVSIFTTRVRAAF
jgi:high affinity Mn2+ porin